MTCHQCGLQMVNVGGVGATDRKHFATAFVCPARACEGYGAVFHPDGSKTQWPEMTLMTSDPLHARIAGATMFKRGRTS